jgi:hypothetical protein
MVCDITQPTDGPICFDNSINYHFMILYPFTEQLTEDTIAQAYFQGSTTTNMVNISMALLHEVFGDSFPDNSGH